jgi:hypothetical protein
MQNALLKLDVSLHGSVQPAGRDMVKPSKRV